MQAKFQDSKLPVEGGIELYVSKNLIVSPKALIVMVHGLCEHSGRYDYVTAKFNACGYSVYRFDNRGHGRSGGDRGYVENFHQFIDDAAKIAEMAKSENPRTPAFMMGHSMGGFIAAACGVKYPGCVTGQVLSGAATVIQPLLAGLEGVDLSASARDPIANALSAQVSRDPNVVAAYENDPLNLKEFTTWLMSEVLIRGARWLMDHTSSYTCPCLVLHGGADQIVTPDSSRQFYERISSGDKSLKIYDGLYHEILNEPEKDTVIEDISAWIARHIAR